MTFSLQESLPTRVNGTQPGPHTPPVGVHTGAHVRAHTYLPAGSCSRLIGPLGQLCRRAPGLGAGSWESSPTMGPPALRRSSSQLPGSLQESVAAGEALAFPWTQKTSPGHHPPCQASPASRGAAQATPSALPRLWDRRPCRPSRPLSGRGYEPASESLTSGCGLGGCISPARGGPMPPPTVQ